MIDTKENCPWEWQVLPILSFKPVDHHQNRKPGNGKHKEWHIILVLKSPDPGIQHQTDPDQNHYRNEQFIFWESAKQTSHGYITPFQYAWIILIFFYWRSTRLHQTFLKRLLSLYHVVQRYMYECHGGIAFGPPCGFGALENSLMTIFSCSSVTSQKQSDDHFLVFLRHISKTVWWPFSRVPPSHLKNSLMTIFSCSFVARRTIAYGYFLQVCPQICPIWQPGNDSNETRYGIYARLTFIPVPVFNRTERKRERLQYRRLHALMSRVQQLPNHSDVPFITQIGIWQDNAACAHCRHDECSSVMPASSAGQ